MAVPKSRTSKARKHSRAANWKISTPAIVECPHCHEPKLAHRVCKKCGYYDGKVVLALDKNDKKDAQFCGEVNQPRFFIDILKTSKHIN